MGFFATEDRGYFCNDWLTRGVTLEGKWACPQCGKQWMVTKHHIIMIDKDSLKCDCGTEIIHWNGGVFYTVTPYSEKPKPSTR